MSGLLEDFVFIKLLSLGGLGCIHPPHARRRVKFFRAIYEQCKVVVDVGTRYNTNYIDISRGNNMIYCLFEANPFFFKTLKAKLAHVNENIYAENVAVGNQYGVGDYYEDTESFLFGTLGVDNSQMKLRQPIRIIRLDDYLVQKDIKRVDFLKVDIEGYDYFALLGLGDFLGGCKYVQFELGIGAPFGDGRVTNEHYYELLKVFFDLYVLKDENNPMWLSGAVYSDLVILSDPLKMAILEYQKIGVGFNMVGVNRSFETDLGRLSVTSFR